MSRNATEFLIEYMSYGYELGAAKTRPSLKTDCLRMLIDYMAYQSLPVPTDYNTYTVDNYKQRFLEDASDASMAIVNFIKSYFVEKQIADVITGDILLIHNSDCNTFGISASGQSVMAIDTTKVRVVLINTAYTVSGCYECQQLYR